MNNIWEKFDQTVDLEALSQDIENAKDNKREFEDVPEGNYEVKITKIELKESKKGDPMISIHMKIVAGKYENQYLFMNLVIAKAYSIHLAKEFLKSLETEVVIDFQSYAQFYKLLDEVMDYIEERELEYQVKFTKNKNGFSVFEIKEVYVKWF